MPYLVDREQAAGVDAVAQIAWMHRHGDRGRRAVDRITYLPARRSCSMARSTRRRTSRYGPPSRTSRCRQVPEVTERLARVRVGRAPGEDRRAASSTLYGPAAWGVGGVLATKRRRRGGRPVARLVRSMDWPPTVTTWPKYANGGVAARGQRARSSAPALPYRSVMTGCELTMPPAPFWMTTSTVFWGSGRPVASAKGHREIGPTVRCAEDRRRSLHGERGRDRVDRERCGNGRGLVLGAPRVGRPEHVFSRRADEGDGNRRPTVRICDRGLSTVSSGRAPAAARQGRAVARKLHGEVRARAVVSGGGPGYDGQAGRRRGRRWSHRAGSPAGLGSDAGLKNSPRFGVERHEPYPPFASLAP